MITLNAKDNVKLRSDLGTQPKWVIDDVWYKADDFDYEGLSESIATDILKTR